MPKVITIEDDPQTLEDVQKLVGGYIESVKPLTSSTSQYWVNEDGLSKNLEPNIEATDILGYPIVGNLVILNGRAKLK